MRDEDKVPTTRERILAVSTMLFAKNGFNGTGIGEIATVAGITKSVIYYHFKNKKEILDTMIDQFIAESMEVKRRQAALLLDGSTVSVHSLVDEMVSHCTTNKDLIRILMMESMKHEGSSPLFHLWDVNVDVGKEVVAGIEDAAKKVFAKERLLEFYFLGVVPILSFFANVDAWSEHHSVEPEKATGMFRDILYLYYEEYILPRFFHTISST